MTTIFENIDILLMMADSKLNIDEVNTELVSLNKQITSKKNELEDLKTLMTDTRYFNASNELVDKNIEISLKNKLNRLNNRLKELTQNLEEIKKEESIMHEEITNLKNSLNSNESYLKTLEIKTKSTNNNKYYQSLFNKEFENHKKLSETLESKEKSYLEILKELELATTSHNELETRISYEKERLLDIEENLSNPKAYFDESLKLSDEKKLKSLEEEIKIAEDHQQELLKDANILGADAKALILENNNYEALSKIRELVNVVKSKPYMDINSKSILDEELEKKENLRVELSNLIENKTYEGLNSNAIKDRITYLEEEINHNNELIAKYNSDIINIDEFINNKLGANINNLETEINKLENSKTEYRKMLKEKNKPLRTKTRLEQSLNQVTKEKNILEDILISYKDNLITKIKDTNSFQNLINDLDAENLYYKEELEKLLKISSIDYNVKDLVSEEKDKEELSKLNEEIRAIKNRQKFTKTPDEIFDEIEMSLASSKNTFTREEKNKDNMDINIENLSVEEPTRLKVIEMIPVEDKMNNVGDDYGA